jgi:hypothetical protein
MQRKVTYVHVRREMKRENSWCEGKYRICNPLEPVSNSFRKWFVSGEMGVEWHYSRSSNPTTTLKNEEEGSEHHFFCILSPLRFLSIACEVQYIRVGTPRWPAHHLASLQSSSDSRRTRRRCRCELAPILVGRRTFSRGPPHYHLDGGWAPR